MQKATFVGHVAQAPVANNGVTRFSLISNEYAGKDKETGEIKERTVALNFSAFGRQGETIASNVMKGDQLIVDYRVENNNYKDSDQKDVYSFNFVVLDFEFGAPGKAKREQLAE